MQQLFAHASGGTYRMSVTKQRVSPSTTATVRKPEPIVTDATRDHEREWLDKDTSLPKYGRLTWRERVYCRLHNAINADYIDESTSVY